MVGYIHNFFYDGQRGTRAVNLQPNLLPVISGIPAQFIERFANLLYSYLMRHVFM